MTKPVLIAMYLLTAQWGLGQTVAVPPDPILPKFGVVGVSSNDKIRLNLLNVSNRRPELPCIVTASLVQAQTAPPCFDCLPPAPLAQSTLTLNSGQAGALEFTPSLPFGARQSLRAVLTPGGLSINCRNVVATLEVFDATTGRLSAFYTPTGALQPPDPVFPHFGLLGITGNDTVRLNVVNARALPSAPCMVRAVFAAAPVCIDSCSSPALTETSLMLGPGQAGVLDYSPILTAGARQSLRAVLVPNDHGMGVCQNLVTTLEVFDRTSGRTFVLQPPDPINVLQSPDPVIPPNPY